MWFCVGAFVGLCLCVGAWVRATWNPSTLLGGLMRNVGFTPEKEKRDVQLICSDNGSVVLTRERHFKDLYKKADQVERLHCCVSHVVLWLELRPASRRPSICRLAGHRAAWMRFFS